MSHISGSQLFSSSPAKKKFYLVTYEDIKIYVF